MESQLAKLEKVLMTFAKQEMGNRITEFNMIGLKAVLINEVIKPYDTGSKSKDATPLVAVNE